jgi:hypothetical protein
MVGRERTGMSVGDGILLAIFVGGLIALLAIKNR